MQVEHESQSEDQAVVRFSVTDTGIGISHHAQRGLFQAFVQADGSTTRKYGGTGLGLAISKQLVELMGGQIGVTSTEGRGSTFWFTARFDKQPAEAAIAQPGLHSLEKARVLVVDDNATNRRILAHQLSSWGMIHSETDSGADALDKLREAAREGAPYDLAVLDLMMPGMDGFELARTIKSDPNIARVRLVLLTSYGARGHDATARESGVAAYLTKPVRQSKLFESLTRVMSQASGEPGSDKAPSPAKGKLLTRYPLRKTKKMTNKLILLAEDNIVNQTIAVRQLLKLGYRADVVSDGQEAVKALAMIPYDLVLMDCQMPLMDGYEATVEIRRREGEGKHTPIVAMTAHALDGDRAKCIAAGMDDYISKPVQAEELEQVLERLLSIAGGSPDSGTTTSQDAQPPVDLERLHMAIGDDPEDLCQIITAYLEQMCGSFRELDVAIEVGDASAVNLIAHNCAGMSASRGITAVIEPFRELERLGLENQLAGAAAVSKTARMEFDRVRLFLENSTEFLTPSVSK